MEKKAKMSEPGTIKNSQEMVALVKRIDKGNPSPEDLQTLSKELNRKPQLWQSLGNHQNQVFTAVLRKVNQSAVVQECGKRYVEEMKTEFGYYSSTFVEKMLIDEIIMRWLRLVLADNAFTVATQQDKFARHGNIP